MIPECTGDNPFRSSSYPALASWVTCAPAARKIGSFPSSSSMQSQKAPRNFETGWFTIIHNLSEYEVGSCFVGCVTYNVDFQHIGQTRGCNMEHFTPLRRSTPPSNPGPTWVDGDGRLFSHICAKWSPPSSPLSFPYAALKLEAVLSIHTASGTLTQRKGPPRRAAALRYMDGSHLSLRRHRENRASWETDMMK